MHYRTENLGEILRGDRISTTAYDVEMNVGYDCRVLCGSTDSPSKFDESQSSTLHYRITQEYFIHMIIGKYSVHTNSCMMELGNLEILP